MDQTLKARQALQSKREDIAQTAKNRTENLFKARVEKNYQSSLQLRRENKELHSDIEFLTKLIHRYEDLVDGFFGDFRPSTGKIIFDLLHSFVSSDSELSDDILKMALELYDASKDVYELILKYIPILPTSKLLNDYKKKIILIFLKV